MNGLPRLGDCWRMDSVEPILKLKPSLVIGSVPFKAEVVAKLLESPLNFLAKNPRTLADVESDVELLGGITNRRKQADTLIAKMRREFAAIQRRSEAAGVLRKKLRVYSEAWPNPRISSPPWVAELVGICGAEMVVPPGQKVTDEEVEAAKPDLIVLAWAATGAKAKPETAYTVERWKDLPAIRNRQVYVVRDELLNTPGPPLLQGAKELSGIFRQATSNREGR